MADSDIRLVEQCVRMLAAAASSARLYPAGSPMTSAAIDRFVEATKEAIAFLGDFRLVIDPKGIRYGETPVAEGSASITGLAETLYAHRAGQLLVTDGVSDRETAAFLAVIDEDPMVVRDHGGIRTALAAAAVAHLILVEIELFDDVDASAVSTLDPMTASLPDMAADLEMSASAWAQAAAAGVALDGAAGLLAGIDLADLPVAQERLAKAMLAMDERSRLAVLDAALTTDTTGRTMDGTLSIVEKLPPAALARLLALFADGSGQRLAGALNTITIPPEAASALEILLASSAESHAGSTLSAVTEDADQIDVALAMDEPGDAEARGQLIESATPEDSARRALDTTLAVLWSRPVGETVTAVGIALKEATRAGAWSTASQAATALDMVSHRHAELTAEVSAALAPLGEVATMKLACGAVTDQGAVRGSSDPRPDASRAAGAAQVLAMGGRAAAEALTETYTATGDEAARGRLAAIAKRLSDPLAGHAARTIGDASSTDAIAMIELLSTMPSRATSSAIARGIDHVDPTVRACAVSTLCASTEPTGRLSAARALDHGDPGTRHVAAKELGRHRVEEAIEPLSGAVWKQSLFARDFEFRRQCIESLVEIGSPGGLPAMRRMASWRFALNDRSRQLRSLAAQAVIHLEQQPPVENEGKARP